MEATTSAPFGERLQASREAAGMTREALAVEVHRSLGSILRWEMGHSTPPRSVRIYIAQMLDDPTLIEVDR